MATCVQGQVSNRRMEENILKQILDGKMKPTKLSLQTLQKITDGFSEDRIIGEGGFGTVYKGVVGNMSVAVKRIRSSMTIDQKLFRREVDSMMEVNHPNVVRFLGLCSHTVETPMKNPESRGYIFAEIRERLLCFEYISNGSLDTKISDELRGLDWDKRYQIIKGICAGLRYLHIEKRILHMDLKPANILLDNQMIPKITDFGLSRPTENSQTKTKNHFASLGYTAPENLVNPGRMTVNSDMYSLGVIMIELVTGYKAISENNNNNVLRRWMHRWNKLPKETSLEYYHQVTKCIEIGSHCKEIDPYARPSISEVMSEFDEMETKNNYDRNTNESTVDQISPPYWEDDMLGVEPLELRFGHNKQQQMLSCSIELSNDTNGFIAFNIQTTSLYPYSIQPNKDILKPRSKFIVVITLPTPNTHDNKGPLHYGTTNKLYTEEFVVKSTKVNGGLTTKDIDKDMFDKNKTGHQVDEIRLAVVSDQPSNKEVMDFPSKQAKKKNIYSGMMSTPIEAGRVQLVIKNSIKAQLSECNKKVMLELTGGDFISDRPGLDLVAVVDVSDDISQEVRHALWFVVRKLGSIDRLSVVTFSKAAREFCSLRYITEDWRGEMECIINVIYLIDEPRGSSSGTNIEEGLLTGLKVLADRKVSGGRVGAVMLISSHRQTIGDATQVTIGNVPVYTFGLGPASDPIVLSAIAANSMGGTFSHVQDQYLSHGGLTKAISQCLAGLVTVSVQDLKLTVAMVKNESMISAVTAGSYPQDASDKPFGSVTVSFGNLYSKEVRKVIVNLLLPAIDNERSAEILKVICSYSSSPSAGSRRFVSPPEALSVWRTNNMEEEEEKPAEIQMEEARLRTAKMIKEARTMADSNMLRDAKHKLGQARDMLTLDKQYNPLLVTELDELLQLLETQDIYGWQGRHYAFSSESSHDRQRFAARSSHIKVMRLFATPRMDKYLEQAKKFNDNRAMPLPLVDDDVKEEIAGLTINNVASRKEEVQRLSSHTEKAILQACGRLGLITSLYS